MGLGPTYCDNCLICYEYEPFFRCPKCHGKDARTYLWALSFHEETMVNLRTRFYRSIPNHVRLFKIHEEWPYTSIRPFMIDNREPNEVYRDWLENNIGKQGMQWDWTLTSDLNILQINFQKAEHAVLFELTWPSQ